jgi:hypothetical protein
MKRALALAACSAFLSAAVPLAKGAAAEPPRVQLSVSPARVAVAGPGARTLTLRNAGAERVVVDVSRPAAARTWLQLVPAHLALGAGRSAILTLRVTPARRMEPGEHRALLLLTTRAPPGGRLNVQVRLGVPVTMRIAGRIVRRLTLGGVRVRARGSARFILVSVANRGTVSVPIRGRVSVVMVRHGRQLARLRLHAPRALQPGAGAVLVLRYTGRAHGLVTAFVRVRLGPGLRVVARRYRLLL